MRLGCSQFPNRLQSRFPMLPTQAERQFEQLKQMIGRRLQQAADAARRPAPAEQDQAADRAAGQLHREQLAAEAQQAGGQPHQGTVAEGGEGLDLQARAVPPLNARMRPPGDAEH